MEVERCQQCDEQCQINQIDSDLIKLGECIFDNDVLYCEVEIGEGVVFKFEVVECWQQYCWQEGQEDFVDKGGDDIFVFIVQFVGEDVGCVVVEEVWYYVGNNQCYVQFVE